VIDHCPDKLHTLCERLSGPSGPFLDDFARTLLANGYKPQVVARLLRDAAHCGKWAARCGIVIKDLNEGVVARFARHLCTCRCLGTEHRGYSRTPARVRIFLQYLRRASVLTAPAPELKRFPVLVEKYCDWMRQQRGLTEATLARHVPLIAALLDAIGEDPKRYDARGLRVFVLTRVKDRERHSGANVTTVVRSFLRYLVAHGQCAADLIGAVPTVPSWRLARLPLYLSVDAVERIIEACRSSTPSRLRDRAMLLLLARLGLRAGDVVRLRLGDIDWKKSRLRVVGKGRRETWLPLPQDAGDAILEYLKHGRPTAGDDHVFLTAQAPTGPLRSNSLSCRVAAAIGRAGVETPSHGAHLLRHSLATRMLREGVTLDVIGAVLRHRDVETTALYSKVDVDLLRQVAQPWPGAEVSLC